MRLLAFALLLALPAHANVASWTSAAFGDDPAVCGADYGTEHEACPPSATVTKLSEFKYWDHIGEAASGSSLFLGTNNGWLWAITCEHCASSSRDNLEFAAHSKWAGQSFDSDDSEGGTQPYRQFNAGRRDDLPDLGGGSVYDGDLLYRYKPAAGEHLPTVPMIPMLRSMGDLKKDTLMLSIGDSAAGAHATIGWFTECATTAAGGGPDPDPVDECCLAERVPNGLFDPPGFGSGEQSPPWKKNTNQAAGWGGEGLFATCGPAGANLEYLGPTWQTFGGPQWSTWHWKPEAVTYDDINDGGRQERAYRDPDITPIPAWSEFADASHCIQGISEDVNFYMDWDPPTGNERTHIACAHNQVKGSSTFSVVSGDSGSPTFAYIDSRPAGNRWVYVSSGQNAWWKHTNALNVNEYDYWVFGVDRRCED